MRVASVLACLSVAFCGCSVTDQGSSTSTATSGPPSYCAGTAPGDQVVVYSAIGLEYWYADVLTNFQDKCHVTIHYVSAPDAQMADRVARERASPLADILIAQAPYMSRSAAAGDLDGTSEGARTVPADRCGRARRWCAVAESYVSWVYNPQAVKIPPATWQDLLSPAYHGQILTARIDQSVDGQALLALLVQLDGVDGAMAYLDALESSTRAHFAVTDTMSRVVGAGVATLADGNLQEHLNDVTQYSHLKIWFPAGAPGERPRTLAMPYGAGLVTGGHHRKAATALLDYLWSSEGQSFTGDANTAPARTDLTPSGPRSIAIRDLLKGVVVLRPDWDSVAASVSEWVQRWLALRRAPDGAPMPFPTPTR
jgi:2-aminoethylphosphonate transport system substrate-binding protein